MQAGIMANSSNSNVKLSVRGIVVELTSTYSEVGNDK